MAVGYVLIGWIAGFVASLTALFGLDMTLLAAFGIFIGTSTLAAFAAILVAAWRMGVFDGDGTDHGGASPALVRSA